MINRNHIMNSALDKLNKILDDSTKDSVCKNIANKITDIIEINMSQIQNNIWSISKNKTYFKSIQLDALKELKV